MSGPDLPAPDELFSLDANFQRRPSGAEKTELVDGVLVFSGQLDDRDVRIAQSAYPGRQVVLNDDKGIEIHPASNTPPRSVLDTFDERRRAALRAIEDAVALTCSHCGLCNEPEGVRWSFIRLSAPPKSFKGQ